MCPPPPPTDQGVGVDISGEIGDVDGDLVGRDKIMVTVLESTGQQGRNRDKVVNEVLARVAGRLASATSAPFLVPYADPSDKLVGRDQVCAHLHALLSNKGRAAIVGTAGIGKTQLAALYAHTRRNAYHDGIFWLTFGSGDTGPLKGQLAEFARQTPGLDLTKKCVRDDSDAASVWIGWVRARRDALLILDDIRDVSSMFRDLAGLANARISAFDCRILVTTRQTTMSGFPVARLNYLDGDTSKALILRDAGRSAPDSELENAALLSIVARLGGLPLAIRMAGRMLRQHDDMAFSAFDQVLSDYGAIDVLTAKGELPDDYESRVAQNFNALIAQVWNQLPSEKGSPHEAMRLLAAFPENQSLPPALLELAADFSSLDDIDNAFGGARAGIVRMLRGLEEAQIVERDGNGGIRLHALVRTFVQKQTDDRFFVLTAERVADRLSDGDTWLRLLSTYPDFGAEKRILSSLGAVSKVLAGKSGVDGNTREILTETSQIVETIHPALSSLDVLAHIQFVAAARTRPRLATALGQASRPDTRPHLHLKWKWNANAVINRVSKPQGILACSFSTDEAHVLVGAPDGCVYRLGCEGGELLDRPKEVGRELGVGNPAVAGGGYVFGIPSSGKLLWHDLGTSTETITSVVGAERIAAWVVKRSECICRIWLSRTKSRPSGIEWFFSLFKSSELIVVDVNMKEGKAPKRTKKARREKNPGLMPFGFTLEGGPIAILTPPMVNVVLWMVEVPVEEILKRSESAMSFGNDGSGGFLGRRLVVWHQGHSEEVSSVFLPNDIVAVATGKAGDRVVIATDVGEVFFFEIGDG